MLGPAPGSMVASMNENQRWVPRNSLSFSTLLLDELHRQTGGKLVEEAVLPPSQLVGDPHFPVAARDSERPARRCESRMRRELGDGTRKEGHESRH